MLASVMTLPARAATQVAPQGLEHARFGHVQLLLPAGAPRGMVLFVSASAGWDSTAQRLAQELASQGAVVAEVDAAHYLRQLRDRRKGCNYVAADLEDLAHRVGREARLTEYLPPVLAGIGEGAALVRVGELQAPPGTFSGALGLGAAAALDVGPAGLCAVARATARYTLGPHGEIQLREDIAADEHYTPLRVAGPAQAPQALRIAYLSLATAAAAPATVALAAEVGDLPLIELPASTPAARFALILSGDGGWAGIDKEVGAQLAAHGLPVVGLNSLKYFWHRRTPEEAAADVARVLRHYLAAWKAEQIVLVGYSFGADALPFIVNRLPPELRRRVASVNLLALGQKADFEVHVTGWVGGVGADALPIAPELLRLGELRRLCFYGKGDKDSTASCATFTGANAAVREVGEGHHFGNLYGQIAAQIIDFADR